MATAAAQAVSGGQSVEMCGQASASADASGARGEEEEAALSGRSSGSPCGGAGRGDPRRMRNLAAAAQARLAVLIPLLFHAPS
jgi:hypothetical protein